MCKTFIANEIIVLKSNNEIPKMKVTLMFFLICLLNGVYSYEMESLRGSKIKAKSRSFNIDTHGGNEIYSPQDKLYDDLSDRDIMPLAQPLTTNCEKPQTSRCRNELAARCLFPECGSGSGSSGYGGGGGGGRGSGSGNDVVSYIVQEYNNVRSPHNNTHNQQYHYNYNKKGCRTNGRGCKRSGRYLRYVRRRMLDSPNKCIQTLGKEYTSCLVERED